MVKHNCSHVSTTELLLQLWNNAPTSQAQLYFNGIPKEPTIEELNDAIHGNDHYLNGRLIKIDFRNLNAVCSDEYDRNVGIGAFERVLKAVENGKTIEKRDESNVVITKDDMVMNVVDYE